MSAPLAPRALSFVSEDVVVAGGTGNVLRFFDATGDDDAACELMSLRDPAQRIITDVGVVEGVAFGMRSGQCRLCNRKRCHRCSVAALAGSKAAPNCLRCAPEAPSPRLKAFQERKARGGKARSDL